MPVALLGVAAVAVSLTAVRLTMGHALGWPSVPVLGMITAVLVAHIIVGFSVGNTLPRLLAPAIILVADYLWIALPPTFNTMWVRHLTGHLETGVPVTEELNTTSLVAPALLAFGIAIGAILVSMAGRKRVLGASLGIICASSACAISYSLVSDWGPSAPVVPRVGAIQCGGSAPRVCLPPELSGAIPTIEQAAVEVLPRLEAVGIDRPQNLVYVSRVSKTAKGTWSLYVSPFFTDDDARASIAEAALPPLPNCLENTDAYVGDPRSLSIWLQLTAGVPSTTVTYAYGPDAMKQVAPIRKLAQGDQTAWFHRNAALLERCEPAPETVIGAP
nr:hypothetical protein OG781_22190 [Streptomyces sp. NBC_00830]